MSSAEQMRAMLRPLGVYDLSGPINAACLEVKGAALDEVTARLEEVGRESGLTTGEDWGLELWQSLLELRPASRSKEELRRAIQALLRMGTGPCTLAAVRDTLSGCGIPTQVEEAGTNLVKVSFPGVAGQPDGFERLRANIEAILPAHLGIEYGFAYLTWEVLESRNWKFRDIESKSWDQLEKSI